jgi:hypothetical protein
MTRKHVIITGTGRAGTSFIIQILTMLGLDTGFNFDEIELHGKSRGGLETGINPDSPYIVKNPFFCNFANKIFEDPGIEIKHIFVPIRNLFAAAESRRYVVRQNKRENHPKIRGGLVHTESMKRGVQEEKLLGMLYNLMLCTSDTFIPLTLIKYPKLVKDSSYLYKKLKPILETISLKKFDLTFKSLIKPDWIHDFTK